MKKVLVSMTIACFLFSLGNVAQYADPGEPIGTVVVEKEKKPKKEKFEYDGNTRKLDPGVPIGS